MTGIVQEQLLTSAKLKLTQLRDVEYLILFPLNTIVVATRVGGSVCLIVIHGDDATWQVLPSLLPGEIGCLLFAG